MNTVKAAHMLNVERCTMGKARSGPVKSNFANNIALFFSIQREHFQELEDYLARGNANLDLLGKRKNISFLV